MKEKDTSDSGNLIQKARQALEKGDQRTAHDFAMAATTDPSQEEQAWLILASLSEPHQALQYLENALKANPRSQAARKAVRLVYSQMAAQEGSQPETPIAPPIKPLEDTAPIPVLDEAPEVDLSAEGYITEELIQMEHESVAAASDQESHASQDATRPPTHERMADLRKKLSRPATH
jgi:hypothetical protein